jgi:hypothetical protein
MNTLVVVRPTTTTLLRQPTLHMTMMIEGPPLLALDAKGGVSSQFTHVWCGLVSPFIYLSILRIVDMYGLFVYLCGVMLGEEPRTRLNL